MTLGIVAQGVFGNETLTALNETVAGIAVWLPIVAGAGLVVTVLWWTLKAAPSSDWSAYSDGEDLEDNSEPQDEVEFKETAVAADACCEYCGSTTTGQDGRCSYCGAPWRGRLK